VADPSTKSRTHRANVCYALNNLRSIQTEIKGEVQFEGLCRVFDSLLRGCGRDAGDIANAKMCIMLAQTFFTMNRDNDNTSTKAEVDDPEDLSISEGSNGESDSIDRTQRTYIKSRLIDNPLFLDDDFWDQALFQCVSESLTQGGVMKNLQRAAMLVKSGELYDETNETKELKNIKWHDFHPEQRAEAALQVHSVVFAQLGALAHSMVEFGCGVQRAASFVRRLSVRHQLPILQRTVLLQHLYSSQTVTNQEAGDKQSS